MIDFSSLDKADLKGKFIVENLANLNRREREGERSCHQLYLKTSDCAILQYIYFRFYT